MSNCLSRRAIFDMLEGDATAEERGHVASCGECQARLHELESAVATAATILRDDALADDVVRPRAVLRRLALPMAATIMLAVSLTLWSGWGVRRTERTFGAQRRVDAALLAEVSKAVAGDDAPARGLPPDSDVAYLQAALDGRLPCEELGRQADIRCY